MEAVVERLDVGDWVEGLPDGLLTAVGERGDQLSAGERQLVALLRAGVADPDVLVLDEATSSVDALTEVRISRALTHLAEGRTTIAIAHRLSTAARADRVLVLARRAPRRGRAPRRAGRAPAARTPASTTPGWPADGRPVLTTSTVRGTSLEDLGVEAERRRPVDGHDAARRLVVERRTSCRAPRTSTVAPGGTSSTSTQSTASGARRDEHASTSACRSPRFSSSPLATISPPSSVVQAVTGRRSGRGRRSARRPGPARR